MREKVLLPVFTVVLLCFLKTAAQIPTAMPPFKIRLTTGKLLSASDLPKQRPVVLIYFAPDCDHCQTLMQAFFKRISEFKNAEIVLVTFKPIRELIPFEKFYRTAQYKNLNVGTEEPALYLQMYYKLQKTPFTALYNKEGSLSYSYKAETVVDDLITRLKKLK